MSEETVAIQPSAEIKELAEKWKTAQLERDKLKIQDEDLKGEINQIRSRLFTLMEQQEILNLRLDAATIFMKASAYPQLMKSKEDVIAWFQEHGHPEVAVMELKISRVKEYLETALAEDRPLPPEDLLVVKPSKSVEIRIKR